MPEHPGFGTSDNPAWLRNIGDLAMYYLDFLDEFGPHGFMSSAIRSAAGPRPRSLCATARGIKSLTLLAPAGIRVKGTLPGDNFIWSPEEAIRNLYHNQGFPTRSWPMPPTDEQADIALNNRFATAKFGWEPRWFNPSLEHWLHRIAVPTLVMWGEQDKLFPSAYAACWGERIAGRRVEIVPECGHVPAFEKPDITAKKIIRLYRGVKLMQFTFFHLMPYRPLDMAERHKHRAGWVVLPNSSTIRKRAPTNTIPISTSSSMPKNSASMSSRSMSTIRPPTA